MNAQRLAALAARARILELRAQVRTGRLSMKALINEGRR
jgi:hypothetical protein